MSQRLQSTLPIAIVAAGLLGSLALVRAKRPVQSEEPVALVPLVRVVPVQKRDVPLNVTAQGTVLPRTETTLAAEVAGRVVAVAPTFEVGGFCERGETLVRLDARVYELAVQRAEARLAQARLRWAEQQAEARVAAEEWRQLEGGEADPLVLREPQITEARAALEAAQAEIEMARLDLEKCLVRCPFDARVRSKEVDVGRYLTPGQTIATLDAVDHAEVRLPVPDRELAFLGLPLAHRGGELSAPAPRVALAADFAGRRQVWEGSIVRTEGEIDSESRMLYLVARIEDPYGRGAHRGRLPLTTGLFVEAEISGRTAAGAVLLPRAALRDEERVLIVDGDDRLRWRSIEVERVQGETAVVSGGLEDGERVCVSPLEVIVDGMQVRTVEVEGPPAPEPIVRDAMDAGETSAIGGGPTVADPARASREPSPGGARGRLLSIEVLDGGDGVTVLEIAVDGELSYATSRLPSPERFIIDLAGVVKADPQSTVEIGEGPAERLRAAQFQAVPEPVTRLVFDLRWSATPAIERTDAGLRVTFGPEG